MKHRRQVGFGLIELLLAAFLGALILTGVFNLFFGMNRLHHKQIVLSAIQERLRFMNRFVRAKIQMVGNWSCALKVSNLPAIIGFNADNARDQFEISAKSHTDMLELHECIKVYGDEIYEPIKFYIADTHRKDASKQVIYALFMKIGKQPREELIPGVDQLQLQFGVTDKNKENIERYESLTDQIDWSHVKSVVMHFNLSEGTFHQAGVLYATKRA